MIDQNETGEVRKDAGSNPADLDVGLNFTPSSDSASPPTPPASVRADIPPAESKDIHADIEKILKEVKLPERRETRGIADAKLETAPTPTVVKEASVVAQSETPSVSADSSLSRVHTLKEDLQKAVRINKMSLVRAVALEEDKKKRSPALIEEPSPIQIGRKKRMLHILFTSALLLLLGTAALFGVYFAAIQRGAIQTPQSTSLVFAEQSLPFAADNSVAATTKQNIAKLRGQQIGSLGSITRIQPKVPFTDTSGNQKDRDATAEEFLKAIGVHPPDELVKALGSEFFFGLHVVDKNAPLMVFTVTSYDHAFAGMLAWEGVMNADLEPIFTAVPANVVDQNGIPSSRIFKDDVLRNYDVRELKDDNSTIELYYSFPTPKLLIIAESPYTFPEVLSRLQSERKL